MCISWIKPDNINLFCVKFSGCINFSFLPLAFEHFFMEQRLKNIFKGLFCYVGFFSLVCFFIWFVFVLNFVSTSPRNCVILQVDADPTLQLPIIIRKSNNTFFFLREMSRKLMEKREVKCAGNSPAETNMPACR